MDLYLSCLEERTASMVMTVSYTRRKAFSFGFAEPQGSKWLWIVVCDFELYIHNPNTHIFESNLSCCVEHPSTWRCGNQTCELLQMSHPVSCFARRCISLKRTPVTPESAKKLTDECMKSEAKSMCRSRRLLYKPICVSKVAHAAALFTFFLLVLLCERDAKLGTGALTTMVRSCLQRKWRKRVPVGC